MQICADSKLNFSGLDLIIVSINNNFQIPSMCSTRPAVFCSLRPRQENLSVGARPKRWRGLEEPDLEVTPDHDGIDCLSAAQTACIKADIANTLGAKIQKSLGFFFYKDCIIGNAIVIFH